MKKLICLFTVCALLMSACAGAEVALRKAPEGKRVLGALENKLLLADFSGSAAYMVYDTQSGKTQPLAYSESLTDMLRLLAGTWPVFKNGKTAEELAQLLATYDANRLLLTALNSRGYLLFRDACKAYAGGLMYASDFGVYVYVDLDTASADIADLEGSYVPNSTDMYVSRENSFASVMEFVSPGDGSRSSFSLPADAESVPCAICLNADLSGAALMRSVKAGEDMTYDISVMSFYEGSASVGTARTFTFQNMPDTVYTSGVNPITSPEDDVYTLVFSRSACLYDGVYVYSRARDELFRLSVSGLFNRVTLGEEIGRLKPMGQLPSGRVVLYDLDRSLLLSLDLTNLTCSQLTSAKQLARELGCSAGEASQAIMSASFCINGLTLTRGQTSAFLVLE